MDSHAREDIRHASRLHREGCERRDLVRPVRSAVLPEGATSAVAVASRIFWALGYNQVELFLTTFDPKNVEFDPQATIRRPSGKRTRFNRDDMNAILERVAKNSDGTYRAVAGRLLPGKVLGGYLFQGTRPDDPNDVVPHEHRRDLRALRVFGAWTNLTDLKAANTLDTLVSRERPDGRQALPAGRRVDVRDGQPASTSGISATSTSTRATPHGSGSSRSALR